MPGGLSTATPTSDRTGEHAARVRAFARRELLPRWEQLDAFGDLPLDLHERFHAEGLGNWWLPERYGGIGLGLEESVDVVSELAYGDAGFAFTSFISILGTTMLSLYGGEAVRDRHLASMVRDGACCATLASERAAGSELTKIVTTAARSGGDVVLNGEKLFATNADQASFLIVVARSASSAEEHLAVVVPRDAPGVRIVKRWEMAGLRASGTYQVSFERCRVPADGVIEGPALRILEAMLNASRILIASSALGIARRVRDLCLEYGRRKRVADRPLVANAVFAAKLGQMEMDVDAMRHVCLGAAREFDATVRRDDGAERLLRAGTLKSALTAKTFCGRTGWEVASVGSEMFGGLGYTRELPIEKLLRDVRNVAIVEGGQDVLRDLVFNRYVLPEDQRI